MRSNKVSIISFIFLSFLLISFMVLGFWAWSSNIEESVNGMGEIVPEGNIRRIMSPITGTIQKVYVKENQEVKAGQILLELNPDSTEAEKDSFSQQLAYLQNESYALKAALGKSNAVITTLGSTQDAWLKATQQAYQAQINDAAMETEKTKYLQQQSMAKEKQIKEILTVEEKLLQQKEQLYKEGGIAEVEVVAQSQKVAQQKGELASTQEEIKARAVEMQQANQKHQQINGTYQKEILGRLAEHEQNILRLDGEINKSQINIKHQIIKAPMDGIINEQAFHGAGEVATVGQALISLVPVDSHLAAEVKITNTDLSYIHLGQDVAIRLEAFPYQQYGRLFGTVDAISPSTVKNSQEKVFYSIRIKLKNQTMSKKGGTAQPLRAGMTISADIITRKRNIFSFFIDPLQDSLNHAFRDPSDR